MPAMRGARVRGSGKGKGMTKVLAIMGGLRKDGNISILKGIITEELKKAGSQWGSNRFPERKIPRYTACMKCFKNKDRLGNC